MFTGNKLKSQVNVGNSMVEWGVLLPVSNLNGTTAYGQL